jgi:hypothetical protein
MSGRRLRWFSLAASASVFVACLLIFSLRRAEALTIRPLIHVHAVPQFARRYNVKCSACHTIVPVLNEQRWMFKRLGFHLPPLVDTFDTYEMTNDAPDNPIYVAIEGIGPAFVTHREALKELTGAIAQHEQAMTQMMKKCS